MRSAISFKVEDKELFRRKLVKYCEKFQYASVYDSCDHYKNQKTSVSYHSYDVLAAFGALEILSDDLFKLDAYRKEKKDWLFGFVSYELKNVIEHLYSVNHDGLAFQKMLFYQPEFVIVCENNNWHIEYRSDLNSKEEALNFVEKIQDYNYTELKLPSVNFNSRVSKEQYCSAVDSILSHIHKGDVYELNYCIEFFAKINNLNSYEAFNQLINKSPSPFSAFLKIDDKFIMSSSPERYIKKEADKIISQPIKGTAKRGGTFDEDEILKEKLKSCVKERSENIMIADLVRNDLSKIAKMGTVKVEELCGIYAFKYVFQMITTIVAEMETERSELDVIKASFPMGSMTGAPKIRAMKLIEKYEETKRGVYSGAVGYFSPQGNFDFNVIIRSLLYNSNSGYLSYMVGSAITEKSIPEKEYEECLLKAKGILQVFN